jgi:hypothetical protein
MSFCAGTHGCVAFITRVYVSYMFKICSSCFPLNKALHCSLIPHKLEDTSLMMLERHAHTEGSGRLHFMTQFHSVVCKHVQRILAPLFLYTITSQIHTFSSSLYKLHKPKSTEVRRSTLRAGFKCQRLGRSPRGLHKIEIESTDFIGILASLNPEKLALYCLLL